MANPIPGTMIVDDPWERAFSDYQQALVDLNGDGVPDAAVPAHAGQPFRIGDQNRPMGLPRMRQAGADVAKPSHDENVAGLNDLLLMAAGGPVLGAARRLGPTAWAALAGTYGMTANAPGSQTTESADFNELRKSLADQGSPELARLYESLNAARSRQGALDAEAGRARPGSQARSAAAGRQALSAEIGGLEQAIAAERSRIDQETRDRAGAVMTGRVAGEAARKRVRDAAPPTFNQYYDDLKKEMPLLPPAWALPFAAGAGAVGATKALGVPSAWLGRAKASSHLARGEYEAANRLARMHSPEKSVSNWLADAGTGATAGFTFGTMPLAADLIMQPADNPERAAQQAYAAELLPIDPKREEAVARANALPRENPALTKAKDWQAWARGMGGGAYEGAASGKIAGIFVDALKPKFTNVRAEASRQQGGGSNQPASYRTYPELPPEVRQQNQANYISRRALTGDDLPVGPTAEVMRNQLASQGFNVPVTANRVSETNKVISDFVAQHGRLPTAQEFASVFNRYTLAIPAGIAASEPLNNLLSLYHGNAGQY